MIQDIWESAGPVVGVVLGVVIGAMLTSRRERKQWQRDQQKAAYMDFLGAYMRFLSPLPPSGYADTALLAGVSHGYVGMEVFGSSKSVSRADAAVRALVALQQNATPNPPAPLLDSASNAYIELVEQIRRDVGSGSADIRAVFANG